MALLLAAALTYGARRIAADVLVITATGSSMQPAERLRTLREAARLFPFDRNIRAYPAEYALAARGLLPPDAVSQAVREAKWGDPYVWWPFETELRRPPDWW